MRVSVPPSMASAIAIKTLPTATCIVRPAEGVSATNGVRLFADQEGNARFFVTPTGSSDAITRLSVECEAANSRTNQIIELRAATTSSPEFPLPPP
jgi:hypothetical protein